MKQRNFGMPVKFKLVICVYSSFVVISFTQTSVTHSRDLAPDSAREHLDEAFEEQGYYLQRLFLEYGTNGTLTYEGLQSMLGRLGLGEVSVLEIRHGAAKQSSPSPPHFHPRSHEDHHHHHHHSHLASVPSNNVSEAVTSRPREITSSVEVKAAASAGAGWRDSSQPASLPAAETGWQADVSVLSDHLTKKHIHENCLNVTQLLWNFGLGQTSHITPSHFTFLCPALLYQIDSGVCLHHAESDTQDVKQSTAFLKALAWASLALLGISLPSLLALALVPLLQPPALHTYLCPLVAMAVGTLCGDALLHLLPHASSGPHSDHRDAVLKGLSVLVGVYILFVFESGLGLKQHSKKSRNKRQDADAVMEMEALEGSSPPEQMVNPESGHRHSHGPPAVGTSGLSSLVCMVIMGDGIHNLTDGLAIGVAFSQSLTGGLSTAIAVLCHEVPHELGDLAMLLAAGWSVRRLATLSLLSALLGYVGVLAGTVLGHRWAGHSPWILTFTAGVFLYVALADMMPEMLHGEPELKSPLRRFILQSLGLLTGGAIMLCIALFEEDMTVNLGLE
ncbi:zinc transporter ZIP5 [Brachyhypopomus gauderio]|uniref:zinc transporter ZIP5 n=1 Tax=Brachyhypopomus gauderio TaxID=698409 RepID=UPI0040420D71